ncbi:hypothetical protein G6M89_17915 [Natronolimnobius sp. AArcel1]|uniref:DUF6517 family protein n=1 Tax=Natronolimnobius sp. AArcel1 TaxID=1679093 RepID=UPI0013EAE25B|nr:DUF6517 family protein [Natronolimnobius sp. AArcel1]NGM70854.1 hypothetical protein [Natronolimnobius sp. AArcel1]
MDRRRFVAAAAVGGITATAGCLGSVEEYITDLTTVNASPAVVSQTAVDDAGYEYHGTQEVIETETVARQSVDAVNYISQYTRTITTPFGVLDGETEAGVFAAITTPQVRLLGEDFNPVSDMTTAEIAEHVQNQYAELEVGDELEERAVAILERESTVDTFDGEATLHGYEGVAVYIDIARLEYGSDHLVLVGVYPDAGTLDRESEAERIDILLEGLEHGDDVEADILEADTDSNADTD